MSPTLVCFASSFAYESAPNITHVTADGERTLCGRTGWATTEGCEDDRDDGDVESLICCLKCLAAYQKRKGRPVNASAIR